MEVFLIGMGYLERFVRVVSGGGEDVFLGAIY